jgi:hypothetical protein
MDNKPLSHIMSDSSHAVDDALETLGNAIIEAINTHFDAGIQVERERIIKLLEERFAENVDHCEWGTHLFLDNAIELFKGETE